MKNYSFVFEGLLHEMMSKEPYKNQEMSYINDKIEMNYSAVSDYITKKGYTRSWEKCVRNSKNTRY